MVKRVFLLGAADVSFTFESARSLFLVSLELESPWMRWRLHVVMHILWAYLYSLVSSYVYLFLPSTMSHVFGDNTDAGIVFSRHSCQLTY